MENDTFDELKEYVELSRRKIRKCMVKTKNQAETKISWNAIWNELQKTDWDVSTELTQRLKVWYLLDTFPAPKSLKPKIIVDKGDSEKQENRDLFHTLPAFMIEDLVQSGDRWNEGASSRNITNITSSNQQGGRIGRQQQQDPVQNLLAPRGSGVNLTNEYRGEGWHKEPSFNFSAPRPPERLGQFYPESTPLSSPNYQTTYTTNEHQSIRRHEIQTKQRAVEKERWCPPVNFPRADSPVFIPRSREIYTQQSWRLEEEAKEFCSPSNYHAKPNGSRRSPSHNFESRPLNVENPNPEGIPWRQPTQQWQLRPMHMEKPMKPNRLRRSSSHKYNHRQLDVENSKSGTRFFQARAEKNRRSRLRGGLPKQKSINPNPPKVRGKPKEPTFPPKGYTPSKGDWVVHAIVSLSVEPNELRLELEKRGYELKYITKRRCTIKNKWVCSLIASADKIHVLTSENIWINSWEVEFVCSEEEIEQFLLK